MIRKGILMWLLSALIFILVFEILYLIDLFSSELSEKAKTEKVELLEIASVDSVENRYWNGEFDVTLDMYKFLYTDPDTGEVCTSDTIKAPHSDLKVGDTAEVVTYNGIPDKLKNDGNKSAKEALSYYIKDGIKEFSIYFVPFILLVLIFRKTIIGEFKRRPLCILFNSIWLALMIMSACFYTEKPEVEGEHWHELGVVVGKAVIVFAGYITSLIAWIFDSIYWNIRLKEENPKPQPMTAE